MRSHAPTLCNKLKWSGPFVLELWPTSSDRLPIVACIWCNWLNASESIPLAIAGDFTVHDSVLAQWISVFTDPQTKGICLIRVVCWNKAVMKFKISICDKLFTQQLLNGCLHLYTGKATLSRKTICKSGMTALSLSIISRGSRPMSFSRSPCEKNSR